MLTAALLVLPASAVHAAPSAASADAVEADQEKPEEPAPASPYADPAPQGAGGVWMGTTFHTRTGWFARASAGASYLHIFRSTASTQVEGTEAFTGTSSVDAVLAEAELAVGGSFARDIGLGLVTRFGEASSASLSTEGESLDLRGGLTTRFLGLTALLYPSSEIGWFLGASAGFEHWSARIEEKALDEIGGNGIGVSLFFGRDFWLGRNLALGALVRLDGGAATGDTERQVNENQIRGTETDYSFKAALAVALTYY